MLPGLRLGVLGSPGITWDQMRHVRNQETRVGCDMKGLGSISSCNLFNWLDVSKLIVVGLLTGLLVAFSILRSLFSTVLIYLVSFGVWNSLEPFFF